MVRKSVFAGAAMLVALSATAGAACLDEVAQLEQRLSQLPSDDAEQQGQQQTADQGQPQQPQQQQTGGGAQVTVITPEGQQQQQAQQPQHEQQAQQQATSGGETVELEMASGEEVDVPVDQTGDGTQPAESWFGEPPPAPSGAEEQLDNARAMAEEGDEQGCMSHVEQAARIIAALEDQQGQRPAAEQGQPQQQPPPQQ